MLVKLKKKDGEKETFVCPRDNKEYNIGYCRKSNCRMFNGYKTMKYRNILCNYSGD